MDSRKHGSPGASGFRFSPGNTGSLRRIRAVTGDTEKPQAGYDKRAKATDIRALMRELAIERAAIIGHDRGARIATRFAKDYPDAVERLVVMDNVPTRVIFDTMDADEARGNWHSIFHRVPDLPEALIAGREERWLRYISTAGVSIRRLLRQRSSPSMSEHSKHRTH
jgi:pimeloyl-ACP methyl ester carboxylesterase